MATRFTREEVIDLLDEFGLSESDSDGEEDPGVSSYLGSGILDLQQLQSLNTVVDGGTNPASWLPPQWPQLFWTPQMRKRGRKTS